MSERQAAYDRFIKRLDEIVAGTYRDGFFTFVVKNVDSTNNHAERIIRYAVIMRKISFHTMSDQGSETMSILMSVFKTLELRDKNVFREALSMTQNYILNQKRTKKNLVA